MHVKRNSESGIGNEFREYRIFSTYSFHILCRTREISIRHSNGYVFIVCLCVYRYRYCAMKRELVCTYRPWQVLYDRLDETKGSDCSKKGANDSPVSIYPCAPCAPTRSFLSRLSRSMGFRIQNSDGGKRGCKAGRHGALPGGRANL